MLQEFCPSYKVSFYFISLLTCVKQLRKKASEGGSGTTSRLIIFKFLFHWAEELCSIYFLSGKFMGENKLTEAQSIPDGSPRYD